MRTSRFADEQQVQAVRQVDAGTPAREAGQPDVLGGGEMRVEGEGASSIGDDARHHGGYSSRSRYTCSRSLGDIAQTGDSTFA
jgi:hypothetical protein